MKNHYPYPDAPGECEIMLRIAAALRSRAARGDAAGQPADEARTVGALNAAADALERLPAAFQAPACEIALGSGFGNSAALQIYPGHVEMDCGDGTYDAALFEMEDGRFCEINGAPLDEANPLDWAAWLQFVDWFEDMARDADYRFTVHA